jgi:hypothetical protein
LLGGNWPLDHDDGSRYIIDRYNVVVYGGTKNYHGYEKQYYGNLFIRPDIGCGEVHCAVNDASGVIAPKSLNENWFNNTCITAGTPYSGQCDKPDPASSTSIQYANNTFLTPSGDPAKLMVSCTGLAPSPPGPSHCATRTKLGCAPAWHCDTCKTNAQNPTDCLTCDAGYTFKKEYSDCTGTCTKHTKAEAFAAAVEVDLDAPEVSFSTWQALGWDKGSKVGKMPTPATITTMMRGMLDLA